MKIHHFYSLAFVAATGAAHPQPAPPVSPAPVANFEYDAQGNATKVIQAPGVPGFGFTTLAGYDRRSRNTSVTDAKSGMASFGYSGRDDLTQVTDPRNLVTQYPRNGLGDATALISPDTGTAGLTYDAAGNLLTRTDSRGVIATHAYDALGRLTSIVYSLTGQPSLTYTWAYDQTGTGYANGVGRLTSTAHPAGSTRYTFDAQGRVLTDRQAVTLPGSIAAVVNTVTYAYDAAGHVTSIVYPSGRKLSITYIGGQPSAIALGKDATANPLNLLTQIKFSPFGEPASWLWQMATATQLYVRTFDLTGRLVRYPLGGFLRDISYDAADRITSFTHYDAGTGTATPAATALNQSFAYDELGRLTAVNTATAGWSFGYDANGNRTSVTLNAVSRAYTTASTSNRLTAIDNPVRSFGHDNAGNTTSDSGNYTATYNLSGRLTTLTKSGVTTSFAYDGFGRRVFKTGTSAAAIKVVFAYDQQGQLIGEYDSNGKALREYVWLGSTPVAMFTPDAVATNPPLVYFIHTDHLGAPRVVFDQNNAIRWRWLAEPFGTTAPETNPNGLGVFTQNLRLPGQYADSETGLFYNYFRDYDASIGRYAQSDPIGLGGGINTYAYVKGNPVSFKDPSGLVGWSGTVGSGGIIDGVGAALFTFNLTSECKCGIKIHIKGYVPTLAGGLGLKYTTNSSPASFSDVFPCPKSDVANGWAGAFSFTSVVGGGVSWGAMKIGSLSSGWPSISGPVYGLDISAGVYVGRGVATSVEVTKCDDCEAKQ